MDTSDGMLSPTEIEFSESWWDELVLNTNMDNFSWLDGVWSGLFSQCILT